jgi:Ca2+-binding EF-hand superfamily protein
MDKFNAEDFIQLTSSTDKAETERLVKKIFSAVDVDNSGFIDQAEMLRMMTLFGEYMRQKAHSDD